MIHIAIPALNEFDHLPNTLDCISKQSYQEFIVYICVNQPESWWNKSDKEEICVNNSKTIEYLNERSDIKLVVIDKSSIGNGWLKEKMGVGWARKTLMDTISQTASPSDIIVCLDADTTINKLYFESILSQFRKHSKCNAISIPYYHQLIGKTEEDRAILRYEIYMRYYVVNLWRISSPYHYTALGSSIAVPVCEYKKIGGMTPKQSGEDFYFLQKLVKSGFISNWNSEKTNPGNRFSDRVFFGTGPAMIKGAQGDWESYPIYNIELFNQIEAFYQQIPELFTKDTPTCFDPYLESSDTKSIWEKLRKNSPKFKQFQQACHTKIDGLRILQFLKSNQQFEAHSNERNLIQYIERYQTPNDLIELNLNSSFSFDQASISQLDKIRNYLMEIEENYQLKEDAKLGKNSSN